MTQERTVTHSPQQATEEAQFQGDSGGDGPGSLVEQAAQWGAVARNSLDDCQRGAEAEQELAKRRNRSGQ